MSNARENPPEHPAWTGRHPDAAGLEEELARAEDLFGPHTEVESAAGQRKQLASDAGLVALLREDGFQGALYDDCIRYLVEYGWPVLITWSVTGEIFRRAQHFGRPVPEELIGAWDRDGRYEVMADTVLAGIKTFREQGLVKGKWKPEGGATLKTYYVNACVLSFQAVYIRWAQERRSSLPVIAAGTAEATRSLGRNQDDPHGRDPFHLAAVREEVRKLLPRIKDPGLRTGVGLLALGYTQKEAAELIGLTAKALEGRLARARSQFRAHAADEDDLGRGGK